MTITPENLQKIQEHLQKMQQAVEAATAALKNDPTSPEYLAQLQLAMSAYSSSTGLAASITKLQADLTKAIHGKL
jgi:type III secretion apparatus needle protein